MEETEAYQVGRTGETALETYLRGVGWTLFPTCERHSAEYQDGTIDKYSDAPRVTVAGEQRVLPDYDAIAPVLSGAALQRFWLEVKVKRRPTWWRNGERYDHGINLRLWQDYLAVSQATAAPLVVACLVQEGPDPEDGGPLDHPDGRPGLYLIHQNSILSNCRVYTGDKMGPGGMIFWPASACRRVAQWDIWQARAAAAANSETDALELGR
jgi:hypothetical protein